MVLVGSGSVSFDTDPDSRSRLFYTDPDPGKLYGFHGSGSATLRISFHADPDPRSQNCPYGSGSRHLIFYSDPNTDRGGVKIK